jgi:PKD repeat protein
MQSPSRRITSLDKSYRTGDLSVFPKALDSKTSLFEAVNNAETKLLHNITPTSKYIIVEDASKLPDNGLIRLSSPSGKGQVEIIFYARKIGNQLHMLQRGYGKTNNSNWPAGALVCCPVMAEHHNALKDAIINIQRKVGTLDSNDTESLTGQLRVLEQRWLTPKAIFKAFPRSGPQDLTVRFQNFSSGYGLRFLWDFGDGVTSTEKSPSHTYNSEGLYTVKLNVVSFNGAAGFTEKANYIEVNNEQRKPFFYATPFSGQSRETVALRALNDDGGATEFTLVDQTDGNIIERHWYFGDGQDITVSNPNIHTIKHVYEKGGEYRPTLLVRYADGRVSRATLTEGITVF